jgi:[NiFe] hydrogenase diaphorase moiety small subunit
MSENTVTIHIDGVEVQAKEGQTVMDAAREAGIYIPHLCYHKDLPPGGHCRVCTVKANGKPNSSCTLPVSEGLVIENDTDEINAMRRDIIEMLFAEGNHVCPSCEASGDCELQALGYRLGLTAVTMPYFNMDRELDASHDELYIDRNRCVLCGRCVRASEVADHKTALGFEGRGVHKRIAVDGEALKETPMSEKDKAARICPTGSLVVKHEAYVNPVGKRRYDTTPIGAETEES